MALFKKKKNENIWRPPNKKLIYPKWSYVYNSDTEEYYLVLSKTKSKFISQRAFWSWSVQPIMGTTETLSGYPLYGQTGFRPGSMIRSITTGAVFYIDGDSKRLITTPDFYSELGFQYNRIIDVSAEEIEFHKEGEQIKSVYLQKNKLG